MGVLPGREGAEHGHEVAEFVVKIRGVMEGAGDGVPDGGAPGRAEAAEFQADGVMTAAQSRGDIPERAFDGISDDPWAQGVEGDAPADGMRGIARRKDRGVSLREDILGPGAVEGVGGGSDFGPGGGAGGRFVMGVGADGIQRFRREVGPAFFGPGMTVVIDQIGVQQPAEIGAESRDITRAVPELGIECQKMPGFSA